MKLIPFPAIFWLSKFIGTVTEKYNCDLLPTFWIFPYFMENRIANRCPTLKLLDYEVSLIFSIVFVD